jgi:PTS system fructose-specific IIC component
MIAVGEDAKEEHLKLLAQLSMKLMDESFRKKLLSAESEEEILSLISEEKQEEKTAVLADLNQKRILAVTACPTGIAHTFMAADKLKQAAKELGVDIKVETNGASGVENRLTAKEIEEADGIIVAVGKTVETARFHGKKVVQVPVSDGIKRPKELIEQVLDGTAPVFTSSDSSSSSDEPKQKVGFYRHLMNGVSEMLPFVISGGILIAICFLFGHNSFNPEDDSYNKFAAMVFEIGAKHAFALMVPILAAFIARSIADKPGFVAGMVGGSLAALGGSGFLGGIVAGFLAGYIALGVKKALTKTPKWLESVKLVLVFPVLNVFITGAIMILVVNTPLSAFNTLLTEWLQGLGSANAVLLGLILGAMMAIDMGGPINKAAYVFATGLVANHLYEPMAAVMAAGMVPPLGIALATVLFKNRFTTEEREAGKTAFVLGSFFITEGAIPFAAADPSRVITASVIGSAIAGALSMLFHLGLTTSHGGIIVFGFVQGGWLYYVTSILAGTVVTAITLGLLKKKIK